MIKLDRTTISVVVSCTDCPWWHGFGLDEVEAWQAGRRHQERHHPGDRQAAKALDKARRRGRHAMPDFQEATGGRSMEA